MNNNDKMFNANFFSNTPTKTNTSINWLLPNSNQSSTPQNQPQNNDVFSQQFGNSAQPNSLNTPASNFPTANFPNNSNSSFLNSASFNPQSSSFPSQISTNTFNTNPLQPNTASNSFLSASNIFSSSKPPNFSTPLSNTSSFQNSTNNVSTWNNPTSTLSVASNIPPASQILPGTSFDAGAQTNMPNFTQPPSFLSPASSFTPLPNLSGIPKTENTSYQSNLSQTWKPSVQPPAWSMSSKGTRSAKYSESSIKEDGNIYCSLVDITAMKEYEAYSNDELRKDDYEVGRTAVPVSSKNFTTNFLETNTQPTSIGAPSLLNIAQPSTFNTAQPFGSSQQNNSASFGASSFPQSSQISSSTGPSTIFSATPNLNSNLNNQSNIFTKPSGITFTSGASIPSAPAFTNQTPSASFNQPQNNMFGSNSFQTNSVTTPSAPSFSFLNTAPQQNKMFNLQPQNTSFFTPNQPLISPQQAFAAYNNAPAQAPAVQQSYADPYFIAGLEFEKSQDQKPGIKTDTPKPLFEFNKDSSSIDLKIRPPKAHSKSGIYTIPDLSNYPHGKSIDNLIIIIENKARIEYLEPISADAVQNLENKIAISDDKIQILDPVGTGLNKKARVLIENVFPFFRSTNTCIKGKCDSWPDVGIQARFIYQLQNDPEREFKSYDVDKGLYVYEVKHF